MAHIKSKKAASSKSSSKISSNYIKGSYKFNYLKFNFSFLSNNNNYNLKKMDKPMKAALIDRIEELSSITYMQISALSKSNGFEEIKEDKFSIKAKYKEKEFNEGNFRDSSNKYSVIRLYPNNNPLPVRLIGKVSNNIFYLLFIEKQHKCYK